MADWLSLRTDAPNVWKREPSEEVPSKMERDLRPRSKLGEGTKSTWSHDDITDATHAVTLSAAGSSNDLPHHVMFHALAFFIWLHRPLESGTAARFDKVNVASFRRSALGATLSEVQPDEHVVESLDALHVELAVADERTRLASCRAILSTGALVSHFTRDQLRPLYLILMERGLIRQKFHAVAQIAFEVRA